MSIEPYNRQAAGLLDALRRGDRDAAWHVKWEHPRFRELDARAVLDGDLDLDDARVVVARDHGFTDWSDLAGFMAELDSNPALQHFEAAVDAIVDGDEPTLRLMLEQNPDMIRARSRRRHHGTLLHYIAANGVENVRQKTPANAVAIARLLLEAGADVDALADMYGNKCTTMSMLVSSGPPAQARLQGQLVEVLLDHGAAFEGPGTDWQSALLTALIFAQSQASEALVKRGAPVNTLEIAAGLGRVDVVRRLLASSDANARHRALALSAQLGQEAVVAMLLDAGEDPNRYNPEGYHAHATPLHQAVSGNRNRVVGLLVQRRARLDIRDKLYQATPLDWAEYLGRAEAAMILRQAAQREDS